jgi:16S rRNA (adenine(1408)-N(1))-methyltransferase
VVVDLGTGDGRAVLARAAVEPRSLVIGIDANAAAMADSSRRAARPVRKGGTSNAMFVVAGAETPPVELCATADLVTVTLPWGSLLRGVLGTDEAALAGIAALVARGGTIEAIVAPSPRDAVAWPTAELLIETIRDAWARHGLCLVSAREATAEDLAATRSTWARRLGLGGPAESDRRSWRLALTKVGDGR